VTTALKRPVAVVAAPGGDAPVADQDQIVRVSAAGVVTMLAGGAPGQADGRAAQATFRGPRGLAVSPGGDVYVSDTGNNAIRVISNGMVRTLASGFSQPMGIALTPDGTLLVADW
jgi:DNA-binding beta-propeller fold protein YncE